MLALIGVDKRGKGSSFCSQRLRLWWEMVVAYGNDKFFTPCSVLKLLKAIFAYVADGILLLVSAEIDQQMIQKWQIVGIT